MTVVVSLVIYRENRKLRSMLSAVESAVISSILPHNSVFTWYKLKL